MPPTHGHRRRYTMTAAAMEQRRIARQCRVYKAGQNPSRAGRTIGMHITEQAAAIVKSYPMGRERRKFVTDAILQKAEQE